MPGISDSGSDGSVAQMIRSADAARPPNVLFLFTDQQRADSLGIVNGWSKTPNLDALAREGALFTDCFTTSPVCIPARFSLMSGLYPHNLGVQTNQKVTFPSWLETWVGRLRAHGYRTSMFGKLHLHPTQGDLRKKVGLVRRYGFDDVDEVAGPRALRSCSAALTDLWHRRGVEDAYRRDVAERMRDKPWIVRPSPVGEELYYDTYVGRSAVRYLREYSRSEPWCCYVGFPGPHEPWDTPEPWASMFAAADMPPPAAVPKSVAGHPVGELEDRLATRPSLAAAEVAALRADYAGEVSLIDSLVGEILQVVRDRGEWDRTIIVFTSDHGEMNGDAGLLYKEVFLDGAVRVPLLIRDPIGPAERVVSDPVELIDVAATILDLAGVSKDGNFAKSVSMGGSVRGDGSRAPRSDVLSEYKGEVMLATPDWKIGLNAEGETYLLFDRSTDESVNLAGDASVADTQHQLERRVLQRLVASSSRDQNFVTFDPTTGITSAIFRRLGGEGRTSSPRMLLGALRRRASASLRRR